MGLFSKKKVKKRVPIKITWGGKLNTGLPKIEEGNYSLERGDKIILYKDGLHDEFHICLEYNEEGIVLLNNFRERGKIAKVKYGKSDEHKKVNIDIKLKSNVKHKKGEQRIRLKEGNFYTIIVYSHIFGVKHEETGRHLLEVLYCDVDLT